MNQSQDYNRDVLNSTKPSKLGPQIHIWRMREAVAWNIGLQLVFVFFCTLLTNISLFNPLTWIGNGIIAFLSSWSRILVLVFIIYIQGEICKKDYITGPVYHSTRFQKLKCVLSIRNLLLLIFHMILGVANLWIYSSILGSAFEYLTTKSCNFNSLSPHQQHCFEEGDSFLFAIGCWLGLYYFFKYYWFGSRNLLFPLIQQHKFYKIKAVLIKTISNSLLDSILPTFLFIAGYYLCNGHIRSLLNFWLILCLWLFSSQFIVSLKMMELLFNIYLTEQHVFPVTSAMLPPENYVSLIDALKEINVPIIHHLAYLDLYSIATMSAHRREQIFTLSLPGGHPHTWNGIFHESLALIKTFTIELCKTLQQPLNTDSNGGDLNQAQKHEVSAFQFHSHNLRRLASPVSHTNSAQSVRSNELQSVVEVGLNNVQSWLNLKLQWVYKKPYMSYFFSESSDFRIKFLLCQSQPVIWAAQSLSFLSAASLTEDRYGIVQKDLPEIITALVNLKQVLDKLSKQLLTKKAFANDPLEVKMKYLLKTSVKRSLYKICDTFGPFLKDLRLPADVETQMNNFISFKEV